MGQEGKVQVGVVGEGTMGHRGPDRHTQEDQGKAATIMCREDRLVVQQEDRLAAEHHRRLYGPSCCRWCTPCRKCAP